MTCFAGATAAAAPELVAENAGGFDKRLAPYSQELIERAQPAPSDERPTQSTALARLSNAKQGERRNRGAPQSEEHQPAGKERASYTKS